MGSVYPLCLVPPQLNFKKKIKMLKNLFFILILTIGIMANEDEVEKEEMLDGAESQNYGYGYGTKVDTPHGSSTVYVHGFGTDDTYHDSYNGHQAYGYGHIDPYLNHKQGYGYTKPGYGYNSVYAPAHHVGGVAHHGVGRCWSCCWSSWSCSSWSGSSWSGSSWSGSSWSSSSWSCCWIWCWVRGSTAFCWKWL